MDPPTSMTSTTSVASMPRVSIHAFAGSVTPGFAGDGGAAVDAVLGDLRCWGSRSGPHGDVILGDQGNHRLRKVDPTGVITTIAGTGVAGRRRRRFGSRRRHDRPATRHRDRPRTATSTSPTGSTARSGRSIRPASSPRSPGRGPPDSPGIAARHSDARAEPPGWTGRRRWRAVHPGHRQQPRPHGGAVAVTSRQPRMNSETASGSSAV